MGKACRQTQTLLRIMMNPLPSLGSAILPGMKPGIGEELEEAHEEKIALV